MAAVVHSPERLRGARGQELLLQHLAEVLADGQLGNVLPAARAYR